LCNGVLEVIGSRKRGCIDDGGRKITYVIRRLRCRVCRRIHHELPDILVPYKRHASKSIEAVVEGEKALSVACDESTLWRWRKWFEKTAVYLIGCMHAIDARYRMEAVEGRSDLSLSVLQRIWQLVGEAPGWLARIVRPVANLNLWLQTRFAFCP